MSTSKASTLTTTAVKFLFYGGKGGVGKTTCAAARAVTAAADGARVLVVSTDPAHSLGDAIGVPLSPRPRRIRPRLDAAELDAPRAFARWLKEYRQPLGDIIEHGTWLDTADVDALLDLSIPGVDELVGMMEIVRIAEAARTPYDLVVADTAPTGHTLRLLAAPETVSAVAHVLETLQHEHRVIREQLARVGGPEAADRLIAMLAEGASATARRLHDPRQTTFCWVTLPETLSLAESEDGVAALERSGLFVPEIIVNRALPDSGIPCPVCDRRRAAETRVLVALRRGVGRSRRVRVVPATLKEPQGLAALASIGRIVADRAASSSRTGGKGARRDVGPAAFSLPVFAETITPESVVTLRTASLLFFGGKGGVGKTTVAAAAALRLARAEPARRVLLLSTDPAHSLADVFESAIGDEARAVANGPANLMVRELDAAAALAQRRAQFEAALDEMALVPTANAAAELMNLAPPGIDELFGIMSVVDARADYDVIVVDTAPTGHALRLLEMPDAARDWLQVLLRVLLKYRTLVRPGQLAAELVDASKSIRELQRLLRDPVQTRFIVVTRAAEVPRRETARLLTRLRRLGLPTPMIVFNALTLAPGRCPRCRAVCAAERREVAALRVPRGCAIIRTPLSAPPPRGVKALNAWAGRWIPAALGAKRAKTQP